MKELLAFQIPRVKKAIGSNPVPGAKRRIVVDAKKKNDYEDYELPPMKRTQYNTFTDLPVVNIPEKEEEKD